MVLFQSDERDPVWIETLLFLKCKSRGCETNNSPLEPKL